MTKKKQAKKSSVSASKVAVIGAGIAALGTGAYYLLGPKSKKHQKKAAVWMSKMQKEIEKKATTAQDYHKAVDVLVENYSQQYKENAGEIKAFAKYLKNQWKVAGNKAKPTIKKVKKTIKK